MFKCTICLLPAEDIGATPCGHTFCTSCLSRHLESIPSCPKCRHPCTIALVLRLHADFDDDAPTIPKAKAKAPTVHVPPNTHHPVVSRVVDAGESAEYYGNDVIHIDSLADLTADLSLGLRDGSPRAIRVAELQSIKLEEEEDERSSLQQLSLYTSQFLEQESRDVTIDRTTAAMAVKASLTNLSGTLTALLTRLKYYMDLTSYVEEAAYHLSRITDRIKDMVQLDKEIEQTTRERDAAMRRYAVANEQMVARLKRYKDEKEVYLKKQLEFAQEREINAIQIIRLEGAVNVIKNRADKYQMKGIVLGGECDSSDSDNDNDELER
ncbi:hypothetical protein BS47DRAFT_1346056 [Hydnum rufescens UP504]|uniref:RING-type domain-containing protein n=1 Tax=Hydnum rufescens UP504 TaxID=1448309 RepID=A0A9P6ATZ4_9AGAM|nr:hypothetical protein BS47DRAFT_1346056 [Hydnum rufescens UP504]